MRKRNVSAQYGVSYDNNNTPSAYSEYSDGGSGNIINMQPAGNSMGAMGGFPQLPRLPNVPQQPTPNLELYNLRCPDGTIMKNGKCKSSGTSGDDGITSDETSNGSGSNGNGSGSGSNGNGSGSGSNGSSGSGNGSSGSGNGAIRTNSKVKKYLIPIVIIGVLAIGYFSIKKVLKNG
jgi:hypothetical protein